MNTTFYQGTVFFQGLHFICQALIFINRVFFYKTNLKLLSRKEDKQFRVVKD